MSFDNLCISCNIIFVWLWICWKLCIGHLIYFLFMFYMYILLNISYYKAFLLTVILQLSFHNFCIYCNIIHLPDSIFVCWKVDIAHLWYLYNFDKYISLNMSYFIVLKLTVFLQLSFHDFCIYFNIILICMLKSLHWSFTIFLQLLRLYFLEHKIFYNFAINSFSTTVIS
jgi:hypothetical protein